MNIKENDQIPSSEIFILEDGEPIKKNIEEILKNKKVVLFGLPGAYTSVCSAKHLPGYVKSFDEAKKKGITKIICVSVNDPNVMKAWGESQNVQDKVFMAADPFCEFTKVIGAEVDKSEKGLGLRSVRYTMLVENEIIKTIKEEKETGICEISAAENFIKNI